MDDTRCRKFFCQPINLYQRRYEALRAVFVEGRSQKEVAEQFGFEQSSLRQLVYEFREQCREPTDVSPFFGNSRSDDRP
jgi:predicted DNA-binding protein (UPF0251 family)